VEPALGETRLPQHRLKMLVVEMAPPHRAAQRFAEDHLGAGEAFRQHALRALLDHC
jgi:hypothetical protein